MSTSVPAPAAAKASGSGSPRKKKASKPEKVTAPPPPEPSDSQDYETTDSGDVAPGRSPSSRESLISEIYEFLHSIPLADLKDIRNTAKTMAGL